MNLEIAQVMRQLIKEQENGVPAASLPGEALEQLVLEDMVTVEEGRAHVSDRAIELLEIDLATFSAISRVARA